MRIVLFVSLLLSRVAIGSPVTTAAGGTTAVVSGHGVRLQLRISRSTHPRDALIRVRLEATNRSNRFVPLCRFCVSAPLTAQVLNRGGDVVYPSELPGMPTPYGPPPSRRAKVGIPAGRTMVTPQYVVLRANRLRAVVRLGLRGELGELATPAVRLGLVSESAPSLRLELQPQVVVRAEPATPVAGPLLYTFSYRCQAGVSGGSDWVSTSGRVLTPDIAPGCGELMEFHVIAGWLGHRVGRLDYARR